MKILWFRRDLRVEDNPLLSIRGDTLPIFIFDHTILSQLSIDDRRVTFIFDRVIELKESLKAVGLNLAIFFGEPKAVFHYLNTLSPKEVLASGDYDSYALKRDKEISHIMPFTYLHDTYIFSPNEVIKKDGTPYMVFTPFYNQAKKIFESSHIMKYEKADNRVIKFSYENMIHIEDEKVSAVPISMESIGFNRVEYDVKSVKSLLLELKSKLSTYQTDRDYIFKNASSNLSVHIRFGTISIREIVRYLLLCKKEGIDTEPFFRQLVFRDFYAYLLWHFPYLETQNFRYSFSGVEDEEKYIAFCEASTGVPIVDAGVTQLIKSGNMQNRVRMICASFFTKDLLLPWQWGEAFFAKHLLDFDSASNVLSWQWSSSTGVDPQPYFRVFNPYLQSKKFDKEALYIKRWLPQLENMEPKNIHSELFLESAQIKDYPKPIVKHKEAARVAIEAFRYNIFKRGDAL